MPLNVKNEDAHNLARELARLTNTTITDAVTMALADAVARARKGGDAPRGRVERELHEIALHAASLPLRDGRSADQILGYGEDGLPS